MKPHVSSRQGGEARISIISTIRRLPMQFLSTVTVAALALVPPLVAQTPGPEPLAVGAEAPDFVLPGATRFGVLAHPVRLSDFKGKTVVLSFFYKARTKG